jgi:hypothetical protein
LGKSLRLPFADKISFLMFLNLILFSFLKAKEAK